MQMSAKYTLVEELGKGSSKQFGRTFLGTSKKTGEAVIIKFVSKKDHPNGVARLINEYSFDFSQTNLPRILDFFESENELILVRVYENGITLGDYWKQLKRKERIPFLMALFEKLTLIFDELSSQHVVHCDIKPSNILIHSSFGSFDVSLIDFGLAIRKDRPEKRNTLFPLGFAAPELLLNELDLVDQRTDIFALGITAWYLFTGELPLTNPNPSIFTNLQITHPLPDHSALPKGWYPILKKMTNKHVFRTAPNLIEKKLLKSHLQTGINGRFSNLHEVILEFKRIPQGKKWLRFR
jgi:serine/threonine protein kinase